MGLLSQNEITMDLEIFIPGIILILLPQILLLRKALKEAKGGEPAQNVIRDANGNVIRVEKTTTLPKPLYKTEMGKWYLWATLVCSGFGIAMIISSFS